MTFQQAVRRAPAPVDGSYRPGKSALGAHSGLVECSDPHRFTGSIDLDTALSDAAAYRNAPRWDYGVGFRRSRTRQVAIWIEVHPAVTSAVGDVLRKLDWLKDWLRREAPELQNLTLAAPEELRFHWLATDSGVHIPKSSPQYRRLAGSGLRRPQRRLRL